MCVIGLMINLITILLGGRTYSQYDYPSLHTIISIMRRLYVPSFNILTINDQVHEDEIDIDVETVDPECGRLHGVVNLGAGPHVHLLGGGLVGLQLQRGCPALGLPRLSGLKLEELWRVVEDGEEEDGHNVELRPPAPGNLGQRNGINWCRVDKIS